MNESPCAGLGRGGQLELDNCQIAMHSCIMHMAMPRHVSHGHTAIPLIPNASSVQHAPVMHLHAWVLQTTGLTAIMGSHDEELVKACLLKRMQFGDWGGGLHRTLQALRSGYADAAVVGG